MKSGKVKLLQKRQNSTMTGRSCSCSVVRTVFIMYISCNLLKSLHETDSQSSAGLSKCLLAHSSPLLCARNAKQTEVLSTAFLSGILLIFFSDAFVPFSPCAHFLSWCFQLPAAPCGSNSRHNAAVSLRNQHLLNKEMISSVSLAVFAVQPQHDTAKVGLFIPESQLMHKSVLALLICAAASTYCFQIKRYE